MSIKKQIAIFASGGGSNASKIIEKSKKQELAFTVKLIIYNNKNAGVKNIAHNFGVPCFYWTNNAIQNTENLIYFLQKNNIDVIILAGFLSKIDKKLVEKFPKKIINIHPALLPNFGGKGMYGKYVHEAVIASQAQESGITIHYVNEDYDDGNIIAQYKCAVVNDDTPETLQHKVLQLEHAHFYKEINNICSKIN